MDEKIIIRLNDKISFRKCSLHNGANVAHGDCTNFHSENSNYTDYYLCNQEGIHFHCTEHPAIELTRDYVDGEDVFLCPKCNRLIEHYDFRELTNESLRMLNIELFKDAKFIRLDDWYVPEVKDKHEVESQYWIKTDVKTDKDGDTIVVVYIGHKGSKEKVQYFIKPEKHQLTCDHKDLDPAKIISKIEVHLRDRVLSQDYE